MEAKFEYPNTIIYKIVSDRHNKAFIGYATNLSINGVFGRCKSVYKQSLESKRFSSYTTFMNEKSARAVTILKFPCNKISVAQSYVEYINYFNNSKVVGSYSKSQDDCLSGKYKKKCDKCGYNVYHLKHHDLVCNKSLSDFPEIESYGYKEIEEYHNKRRYKIYKKCDICNYKMEEGKECRECVSRIMNKSIECNTCDKSYSYKNEAKHKESKYCREYKENNRKIPCENCDKFVTKKSMKIHLKTGYCKNYVNL